MLVLDWCEAKQNDKPSSEETGPIYFPPTHTIIIIIIVTLLCFNAITVGLQPLSTSLKRQKM